MSLNNDHLSMIKSLGYTPVGLNKGNFSKEWLRDNTGDHISEKNSYYGEYTFYYWYWKNLLKYKKDNEWVGFCSYREYWGNNKNNDSKKLNDLVLKDYNADWSKYDAIIGKPIDIASIMLIGKPSYNDVER